MNSKCWHPVLRSDILWSVLGQTNLDCPKVSLFYNESNSWKRQRAFLCLFFTDETPCPAGWLGNGGRCYKFDQSSATADVAQTTCMQYDAYLFNPSNLNRTLFVDDFVSTSGLFTDDVWLTGLWPTTFGGSFTESSGRIAPIDLSSAADAPKSYTGYSVSDGEWVHRETDLPFICETDPGKYIFVPVRSTAICFPNMNFKMLT